MSTAQCPAHLRVALAVFQRRLRHATASRPEANKLLSVDVQARLGRLVAMVTVALVTWNVYLFIFIDSNITKFQNINKKNTIKPIISLR